MGFERGCEALGEMIGVLLNGEPRKQAGWFERIRNLGIQVHLSVLKRIEWSVPKKVSYLYHYP